MNHEWVRRLIEAHWSDREPLLPDARWEISSPQSITPADALRLMAPCKGWCCLTDRVVDLPSERPLQGMPLSAEWVSSGVSHHLRYDGHHQWLYRSIRSTRESPDLWVFRHDLQRIAGGTLHYEVAWKADEMGVFRPWASRLIDISPPSTHA